MKELKTIGIVGATALGRKLAYASTLAGYRTILEDVSPLAREQGIAWIARALGEDCAHGKISAAARDSALTNLGTANSAEEAAREADLIIEAVSDEMEMKIELFTIFDKFAKPGAVFASTTASLSITELASVTNCPDRCIGMHCSMVTQSAERIELVRGRETSEETVAACREVARRMGKEVSVLGDEQILFASGND
jgi:3-hydroxybutyryl-CoA dehydrogenase